jgi:DNA-binding CsgD family transcriptional regulator
LRQAEEDFDVIAVELRLGDPALERRILDWIEASGRFVLGVAGDGLPVVIAGHIPDDIPGPIVLLADAEDLEAMPKDPRVAARLPPDVGLTKLRIALEAAAHGLSISEAVHKPAGAASLSQRELEVLRHLAEGASNKAIARALAISTHTVKFHVAAILEKLGASTRTEAAMQALRLGLLML